MGGVFLPGKALLLLLRKEEGAEVCGPKLLHSWLGSGRPTEKEHSTSGGRLECRESAGVYLAAGRPKWVLAGPNLSGREMSAEPKFPH